MFWKYTRNETKILLNLSLLLFAGFTLYIGELWKIVNYTEEQLSATTVGVFVGVEKNEINTLVAKLDQREKALNAREMALVERSSYVDKTTLHSMLLVAGALFGLVMLNFYLDYKRRESIPV